MVTGPANSKLRHVLKFALKMHLLPYLGLAVVQFKLTRETRRRFVARREVSIAVGQRHNSTCPSPNRA